MRRGGGEPGDARWMSSSGTRGAGGDSGEGGWLADRLGLGDEVTCVDAVGVVVAVSVLSRGWRSWKSITFIFNRQIQIDISRINTPQNHYLSNVPSTANWRLVFPSSFHT